MQFHSTKIVIVLLCGMYGALAMHGEKKDPELLSDSELISVWNTSFIEEGMFREKKRRIELLVSAAISKEKLRVIEYCCDSKKYQSRYSSPNHTFKQLLSRANITGLNINSKFIMYEKLIGESKEQTKSFKEQDCTYLGLFLGAKSWRSLQDDRDCTDLEKECMYSLLQLGTRDFHFEEFMNSALGKAIHLIKKKFKVS